MQGNIHRVNTELSLDLKIDSVFWVSNEDIDIAFNRNIRFESENASWPPTAAKSVEL